MKATIKTIFMGWRRISNKRTVPGTGDWDLVHKHCKGILVLVRAICLELWPIPRRRCTANPYRNRVALSKHSEPQMWGSWFQTQDLPLILHISLPKLWFSCLSDGTNNMRLVRIQLDSTWKCLLRLASDTFEVPNHARWMLLAPGKQFEIKALLRGPEV